MISLSYWNIKFIKYRKAAILLVFTLIIGPGLFVNVLFKDHAGRPRPRDIVEFNGTEQYICPCVVGENKDGKSFPCGHCSMGFYLAIPYLFLRNRRKLLAYTFLAGGIVYGIIIGIARMMVGAHFASDVLWAGGIVWLIALIGFYLFKVDKPVEVKQIPEYIVKKKARRATVIIGIILPVITIGLMLATTYISKKNLSIKTSELKKNNCKNIEMDLKDATAIIDVDTCFHLEYKVNAFGFPNSKIRGSWTVGDTSYYIINYMGWFTEVKNVIHIHLSNYDTVQYKFKINSGKILLNLPDSCLSNLYTYISEGNIILTLNNNTVLIGDSTKIINEHHKKIKCLALKNRKLKTNYIEFKVLNGKFYIE